MGNSNDRQAMRSTATNRLILCMGVFYLLFLIWAILWKCSTPFVGDGSERAINLLPLRGNTMWELQFNVAIFMPFGFYLAAWVREWSFARKVLCTLLVSLALEVAQFALAIGRSDVTDLLMNVIGGVVGIAAFTLLSLLFHGNVPKMALTGCLILTAFTVYMVVSFAFFGVLNLGYMMVRI
jgi:glycopeptide antibiotics resistance protein